MFKQSVIHILITLTLSGCAQVKDEADSSNELIFETLDEWLNKEIALDFNIGYFTSNGVDTIERIPVSNKFKILRYIDRNGCTLCRLQMQKYFEILKELEDSAKTNIGYYCIVASDDVDKLSTLINLSPIKLPIWVDPTDSLNRKYSFPSAYGLQTFLLDVNNRVLAVGDPVGNPLVKELYFDIITNDSINCSLAPRTELKIEIKELFLGVITRGDSVNVSFAVKNIGENDFVSKGVSTSCDCTTAILRSETIKPGETAMIDVTFIEKNQLGDFFRTITLYGNINRDCTFEISGTVVTD